MTCARGGPCRRLQPVFSLSQTLIRDWYGTSRRFASTLIRSSRSTGKRREIDLVVGFRLGNRTGLACDQSTYSVESWVSQNLRSAASERNLGIVFRRLAISE